MALISCPHCGKRHRTQDKIDICKFECAFLKEIRSKLPKALPNGSTEPWGEFSEGYLAFWWGTITVHIRKRDKNKCQKCGAVERPRIWKEEGEVEDEGVVLEVHHIIPRARGGTSRPENLVTLCHECHTKTYHLSHSKLLQMTNKAKKDPGQSKIINFQ